MTLRLRIYVSLLSAFLGAAAAPGLAQDPPTPSRLAQLLADAAKFDEAGKFAEALPLRKEIFELVVKQHGADSLDAAEALSAVAHNHRCRSAFDQAEEPARQALAIRQQKLDEKHLSLINSYGQLVDILNHRKKFKEAEPLARKLVALREEVLGKEHVETADSYAMLSGTLFFLEQGAEAAALNQRAWEIYSVRLGKDHERTRRAEAGCSDCLNVELRNRYVAASQRHPGDDFAAQYETFAAMLEVMAKVFPPDRYPNGNRRLARVLMRLGELRSSQGRQAEARPWFEKALTMQEKLLLPEYPEGHPELIETHNRLSKTLHAHGEYDLAGRHARQALTMARACYPASDYPEGHALLATAMSDLAFMIGGGQEGKRLYEEALAMQRKLYPADKFPRGHKQIVATLYNLGNVLIALQDAKGAAERLREAYDMSVRLDNGPSFGQVVSLQYLGRLYDRANQPDEAERCFEAGLELQSKLYPPDLYPQGHGDMVWFQGEFAEFLHARGKSRAAATKLAAAESMRQALAVAHLASVSEAEALNFSLLHLGPRDLLLSTWHAGGQPDADAYEHVWQARGLIHRTLARRRQAVLETNSPEAKQLLAAYQEKRQQLAQMAFMPAGQTDQLAAVRQRLNSLTKEKEQLERQLAELVPDFRMKLVADKPPQHQQLIDRLPAGSAFVEFVQFGYFPPGADGPRPTSTLLKAIDKKTPCYAAFVLLPGAQARRIDLGPAAPIDKAIERWRSEIISGRTDAAGAEVRKLLWAPIEEQLGSQVRTIYIVPDGRMSSIPWPALPGAERGKVLLEQFAMAVVPYGQFLLEQLTPREHPAGPVELLAVGNPDFGASADATRDAWPRLPGTQKELDELASFAGSRVTVVAGSGATTDRILRELPKANVAHLATHGFFADAQLKSFLQLDQETFAADNRQAGVRSSVADRNPLLLSGVVLAGANRPGDGNSARSAGGILTAEAIAGLPLDRLQLAVLSACDTGLGDVAGGEGVFGLQRAFHQAGTQNVVASLWKVNDDSTAALMRLFYHHLLDEKLPPLESLRQAQLALYRRPDQITALATTTRGPNFNKVVKLVAGGAAGENPTRSPPRAWAAFVLSGRGE